jgi:hypothetical protein
MNKLALPYLALQHSAIRIDDPTATQTAAPSVSTAHQHNRHGLACAWRIDPSTGRLVCVWSQS